MTKKRTDENIAKLTKKLYKEPYRNIQRIAKKTNGRNKPPINSIKGKLIAWIISEGAIN